MFFAPIAIPFYEVTISEVNSQAAVSEGPETGLQRGRFLRTVLADDESVENTRLAPAS